MTENDYAIQAIYSHIIVILPYKSSRTFSGTVMCSTLLCRGQEGTVVPNLRFGTTGSLTLYRT